MVEDKSTYISQGKRGNGRKTYTYLLKRSYVLSSGGILKNYSYMFRIDTIKVISLMKNIQENIQLKDICLGDFTISCHKFKYIPVYERGGKFIQSLFKEYNDALPEDKGLIGFPTFDYIVKLLTLRGKSKAGFSTYYIKFCHGKKVFDHMLDSIGQMDLNGISSIDIIGFRISLKK